MVSLFFGDLCTVLSTIFLLAVLAFIVFLIVKRDGIERWGRRTFILAVSGLVVCCFVSTRDGYADALRGGTGFFALDSMQIFLAQVAGAVNGYATLSSVFVLNQKYRKAMFFTLSGSIVFKACLIEISRIVLA